MEDDRHTHTLPGTAFVPITQPLLPLHRARLVHSNATLLLAAGAPITGQPQVICAGSPGLDAQIGWPLQPARTGNVRDMTYALLNKLTAKPGQRQQVVDILLESGKLLFPDNPACHMYMVSAATEDPNVIWVTDWKSVV